MLKNTVIQSPNKSRQGFLALIHFVSKSFIMKEATTQSIMIVNLIALNLRET